MAKKAKKETDEHEGMMHVKALVDGRRHYVWIPIPEGSEVEE